MASPQAWLEVLAWTKALFDFVTSSANLYDAYERHKGESDTQKEALRVSEVFSSFSDEEVNAMEERLKGCRDRFIEQGGGADRARCICSVLNEVSKGNGGVLPDIDDWKHFFATLKC
jgi:hypothetical protein